MSAVDTAANVVRTRVQARAKTRPKLGTKAASKAVTVSKPLRRRPRSAVTSGRRLFVQGDPNSQWARRYSDLVAGHVADLGGRDLLSEAQLSLIRRAATIEAELERLDAALSRGEPCNMDEYGRVTSHLRRLFETLGLERRPREVGEVTLAELLRSPPPEVTE